MSDFRDLAQLCPGVRPLEASASIGYRIEAERDMRRLGLHRIEEALDLPKEELRRLVAKLLDDSKRRQASLEEDLKLALMPWMAE